MAGLEVRDFSAPDETRAPDKTKIDIVRMGAEYDDAEFLGRLGGERRDAGGQECQERQSDRSVLPCL